MNQIKNRPMQKIPDENKTSNFEWAGEKWALKKKKNAKNLIVITKCTKRVKMTVAKKMLVRR